MNLAYFKNPVYQATESSTFRTSLKVLFSVFLYTNLFLFVSYLFVTALDFILKSEYNFSFLRLIDKLQATNSNWYDFLYILIAAPILEEIMFRLPLKFNRINVFVALLTFYFFFYLRYADLYASFWGSQLIITIFFIAICWIVVFYVCKNSFYKTISTRYFGFLFYILAITFGLLHITNFIEFVPKNLLFFSPIFTLHQVIMGLFLGYIRVKKGLIWSIALHVCYNTPGAIHYFFVS